MSHVHNPILTAPDVLGETNEQSQSWQLICCMRLLKETSTLLPMLLLAL